MLGLNAGLAPGGEKPLQTFVFEACDHKLGVTYAVTGYKGPNDQDREVDGVWHGYLNNPREESVCNYAPADINKTVNVSVSDPVSCDSSESPLDPWIICLPEKQAVRRSFSLSALRIATVHHILPGPACGQAS